MVVYLWQDEGRKGKREGERAADLQWQSWTLTLTQEWRCHLAGVMVKLPSILPLRLWRLCGRLLSVGNPHRKMLVEKTSRLHTNPSQGPATCFPKSIPCIMFESSLPFTTWGDLVKSP
jgi:hypothetical protein